MYREREREGGQTDRDTERDTDRQTESERQRDRAVSGDSDALLCGYNIKQKAPYADGDRRGEEEMGRSTSARPYPAAIGNDPGDDLHRNWLRVMEWS